MRMYNGVLMARRWLLLAVLVCMTTQVSAQRVFKTIKPDEVDDTLKFDVNTVPVRSATWQQLDTRYVVAGTTVERAVYDPSLLTSGSVQDLNFCPNVVFSPDSTKGFVSFPGSDKVMVFNPKTGEIISILQIAMNPGQLSITPDGKSVLVLCLFFERNTPKGQKFESDEVATLAAIDVDTLEVRTLDLTQVWFSLYNNIVFSSDGQTAYVASMGTNQVLRFDVDSLTEIQPRLDLRAASLPASLTMAPDGSFMTAVLTNSPEVNITTTPDSIVLIDTEQFRVTRELAPPAGPQEKDQSAKAPAVITAMNNVAFTPDGKYGVIGDQSYSWTSSIPENTYDRAWVFNVETGEFKLYLAYGPIASIYTAPDGRFVVPGFLFFTIIDPVAQTSVQVSPLVVHDGFLPRTSVAFSADGSLMYFGVPYFDLVDSLNLVTRELPTSTPVGGTLARSDGEILSSAPMQVAFTPDHQVLVTVNFNSNTLDLLENTTHTSMAGVLSNEEFFTGVALTNPSSEDANVNITGYGDDGQAFADDTTTEDVVEYVNPQEVTIPAGNQIAETAQETLTGQGQSISGWFDVDSDQPDLRGFSLMGDRALKRLDGVVATHRTSVQFIVPEVRVNDGFDTQLVVLNPNLQAVSVQAELFSSAGESLGTVQSSVPRRGQIVQFLRDPDPEDTSTSGMFSEASFEDFEDGYVVVTAETGVIVVERYYDDERMSALDCTPIGERDAKPTRFFVPQVVEFEGNDTTLKMVNSHPVPPEETTDGSDPIDPETLKLTVQLSLKGNEGQDLAAPVTVELAAGESIRKSVAELFGLEDNGGIVSGWILVDVDQEGLVGSAEFQVYDGKGMSTIPFESAPSSQMIFSHVAEGLGLSTGLVLINPGTSDANVTLQVFSSDGQLNSSTQLQIPAGGRIAGLLPELLDGLDDQIGGYIKVDSDSGLVGLELFYANSLEYIAAVEAQ